MLRDVQAFDLALFVDALGNEHRNPATAAAPAIDATLTINSPEAPVLQSERAGVGLAGANANHVLDRRDENLAVADLAGLGGSTDGLDYFVDLVCRDSDLEADFRQEIHRVFGATINLGMALLPAVTFDLGDGHAVDAGLKNGVAYVFKFEWFNDRDDELHETLLQDVLRLADSIGVQP